MRAAAPLGAGDLGEGYLAFDPELERQVALKVLPADVALPRADLPQEASTRLALSFGARVESLRRIVLPGVARD